MYQTDPPIPPKESLPTMYDLPSEDPEEPGLPDEFHIYQPQLLEETFRPPTYGADEVFVASDLNLYYDSRNPLWYKRPDWFAVVGNSRFYQRRDLRLSYVIWQEGISPFVAVELLSPGTEKEDLGQSLRIVEVDKPPTKWQVYEQILRIPYYIVFDPYGFSSYSTWGDPKTVLLHRYTDNLRAFVLQAESYTELTLEEPRIWMPRLEMGLGLWQGNYKGIERLWLRWYEDNGNWIPTPTEQESQRAERLAAKLRELGVNPDEL
ncbi:MAG: Uma2 family endonuclease [Cyanobacteria bacterium P01_A01_bin.80]